MPKKKQPALTNHLLFLDEEDLRWNMGEITVERGRDYWLNGKVLQTSVSFDKSVVRATVAGSKRTTYTVAVILFQRTENTLFISGDCTCPMNFNCKHVAATLLAIMHDKRKEETPDAALSPKLFMWLNDLQQALQPPAKFEAKPGDQVLLYLIRLAEWQFNPKPAIKPCKVKKQKSGGYSDGRETDFSVFSRRGTDFEVEDYEIANLLMLGNDDGYGSWYSGHLPNSPELVDSLMTKLLLTGRCHFQNAKNPPLQFGDPRTAEVSFVVQPDGRQSTQIAIEGGGTLLWSQSPWYVDQAASLAGPVKLSIPHKVAEVLLAAPPLSATEASKVHRSLLNLNSNLPIPLPKSDTEITVVKRTPKVRLGLYSHADSKLSGSADTWGEVAFDYGDLKFAAGQNHIEQECDGKTLIIQPDRKAEEAAIAQVLKLGLVPDRVSFLPGAQDSSQRFVVNGDQTRGWLQVIQNLEDLRSENIAVDVDPDFAFNAVDYDGEWQYDLTDDDSPGWFNLNLGIEFEGQKISLLPIIMAALKELRAPNSELSSLNIDGKFYAKMEDGRLLGLPFERVEKIFKILIDLFDSEGERRKLTLAQALDLAAIDESVLAGCRRLKEIATRLKNIQEISEVVPPADLQTNLRSYQLTGLSWLQFLSEFGLGGILADDMGLGKTIQTIAHILVEKQNGRLKNKPFLIVCPTSVVPNWISELAKFAPQLQIVVLHGIKRTDQFKNVKKADVVITSYALLTRDVEQLREHHWRGIAMDEAQYIKNPATKISQSACKLMADHRICLTGTPVENHLGELWSQFHFLNPGMLGNSKRFSELFRVPIEQQGNMERQKLLSSRLKPFMIRRTKSEVEKDLPPKTVIVKPSELDGPQRDLYELIRVSMHKKVKDEIANKGLSRSQITILEALLKLRQACCDPRLLKMENKVNDSAKLNLLTEMLTELVSEGRKVLLFSQFTSMLDLIEPELVKLRIPFVQIRGDTTDRTTPVKRFQNGDVPVFLLSLKAGGTGLNLTAADTVIHYDPWWNPAVEDQATDRAYRIGQDKPVFVYKLIASGTIEERMLELQERKRKIANAIYDAERAGSLKFDETDLEYLFSPIGTN